MVTGLPYDHQFRLKTSVTTVSKWLVIDTTLWNLAFSSQVSPPPKDDRGEYRSQHYTPSNHSTPSVTSPLFRNRPICFEWNDSPLLGCPHPKCRYEHSCYRCAHNPNEPNKHHKAIFCPHKGKKSQTYTLTPAVQCSTRQ